LCLDGLHSMRTSHIPEILHPARFFAYTPRPSLVAQFETATKVMKMSDVTPAAAADEVGQFAFFHLADPFTAQITINCTLLMRRAVCRIGDVGRRSRVQRSLPR